MTPPGTGGRRLLTVAVGLLLGAAATWGASRLDWFTATVSTARGPVDVAATGAQLTPVPGGMALVAAAGVAAAVAVSGVARRVLGGLLAAAALGTGWAVGATAAVRPGAARLADLSGVAVAPGAAAAPVVGTAAPVLALAGALAVFLAGLLLVVRERGMPRLGARYAAPADGRRPTDPDRAAWEELDAGGDPTVDGPGPGDEAPGVAGEARGGPDRGPGERAV
jgi:uncharacterized membrane protein (TIGR02234 family)